MYELHQIYTNGFDINNTLEEQDEDGAATAHNRTCPAEYDDPYNEEENENIQYQYDNYEGSHHDRYMHFHGNTDSDHTLEHNQDNNYEYNGNFQYNSINPAQFPVNYPQHPGQHAFPYYDNYGRPLGYNVENNNLYRGNPPNLFPGAPGPVYQYPQIQPHFGGIPRQGHEVDPTTGETWLYFDPIYHTKKDNNKIEMWTADGPKLLNVQYKIGHPHMFKTVTTTAARNISPFIDGREGHSILLTSFNRSVSSNEFGNAKRIPFETRLDTGSGLAATLDLLKGLDTQMSIATFDNNIKALFDLFPKTAFDPLTIADFTSGWNLSSSSFVAFAKDKILKIEKLNEHIDENRKFQVPHQLLIDEREARSRVLNTFTPLHFLDLLGEKIDAMDDLTRRSTGLSSAQTKAIGRTLLPNLRSDIIDWKVAKMKVRKAVLKDHNHPNNLRLLRSSLWDENLFPKMVADTLKEQGGRYSTPLLGFGQTSSRNNGYQQNSNKRGRHFNNHNQFDHPRYPNRGQQHTFRDRKPDKTQYQSQNHQGTSSTTQQAKIPTRGNSNTSSVRGQGRGSRGRGSMGRGAPYPRPTSSNKKETQSK